MQVADTAENLGLFWYLYVEIFKDYLGFFKVAYCLVKSLIGLLNFSLAKELDSKVMILAMITLQTFEKFILS